jgi:hypothetical protein
MRCLPIRPPSINRQLCYRLRDALLLIEETASVETPVPLLLQDVVLLGRQLLQRLR